MFKNTRVRRLLFKDLQAWKESPFRKPLILKGIRQVGETWVLKAFGKANYQNTAYFNFDEEPDLKQFFASSKNPKRILQNLSLVAGQAIEPAKILDFQVSVNSFIAFFYLKLAVIFYNRFAVRKSSASQARIQSVLESACLGQIIFSFFLNNQPANKQVGA